jgi:hypothetical protein
MPCLGLKIILGSQMAGLVLSTFVAAAGAKTVVITAAALAAVAVQLAGIVFTGQSLIDCLENAGRQEDADRLRQELDAVKREVERLPH